MSAVELRIDPRDRPVGRGRVRRLLPHRTRRMVGPFIFADVIGPDDLDPGSGVDVDAHPHIGLSTLTYLFAGRMIHRDSTGAVQAIEPGAVNWMTAGSGVVHTERSHPDDRATRRRIHGLQTWVALPDDAQEVSPSFQHAAAADIPRLGVGDSTVRLAAGSGWGAASPVTGSSPLVLAEVEVRPGSPVPVDVGHSDVGVIAIAGHLTVDDEHVPPGRLVVLRPGVTGVLGGSATGMVLGGEPVGRRHIWWNFVHRDRDRIEQAKSDWAAQRFSRVPGDHDPWVPLPG
jgi:redox-sensitive bicupin YhaK (pirin superfamily)